MQAFEGKKEKTLTRKVGQYELSTSKGELQLHLAFVSDLVLSRSIFEFYPFLLFFISCPMSTVAISEMQRSKG